MRDFEAYYSAGATANAGGDPYSRDIWRVEKTIAGVDPRRDELLPFVGPSAALPLWRAIALLSYERATRLWGALLAIALCCVIFGALSLARAPRSGFVLFGATIFAGSYGPLTSDVALGQVALVSAAGIILAQIALRRNALFATALASCLAALQPNLALTLVARVRGRRAFLAFAVGFALFALLTLMSGGLHGIASYLELLRAHGAAERYTVIQIAPGAIAYGFGAGEAAAAIVGGSATLIAIALVILACRRIEDPQGRVALAACALPFALPFFHEHDFVVTLLASFICAVRARGATLAFAAVATILCAVDWLGLGQRPTGATQSVLLAVASALGFAIVARLSPYAFAGLCVPAVVAIVGTIAHISPVPIWPDALPPAWQAPITASITRVWELEQTISGLTAQNALWAMLRSWSLFGSGLLGVAVFFVVRARSKMPQSGTSPV